MSVTFETPAPVLHWALTCGHPNGVTGHRFDVWAEARDFLLTEMESHDGRTGHLAVCGDTDCQFERMMTHAVTDNPGPHVRVSNSNARIVLNAMGLAAQSESEGVCGSLTGTAFADALHEGFRGVNTATPQGGYIYDRLRDLTLVVMHAADTGRPVQWA